MKESKRKNLKLLQNLIQLCIVFLLIVSVYYTTNQTSPYRRTAVVRKQHYLNPEYNYTRIEYFLNASAQLKNSNEYLIDDITVVTAYFNIGTFDKGETEQFTPALYRKWMQIFKYIDSPTVAYFDHPEFCDYFKILRQHLPSNKTQVILVNRKDLWSFQLHDKIEDIFLQPGYPRHKPNTVNPLYSSTMHAKYELMKRSIVENIFKTKYISWLDIGLFRDIIGRKSRFGLYPPKTLSDHGIGYAEVYSRRHELTSRDIIYGNEVWVCGCFFIGKVDTMLRWTLEYLEGVDWLIKRKLMSTDQQVIYILVNANLVKTKIQTFRSNGTYSNWFHLGYVAKDMWKDRKAKIHGSQALRSAETIH